MVWYKIKKNVLDLMDFLIDAELITTRDDVIDLVKFPSRYTEVWQLYQKEMNGVY